MFINYFNNVKMKQKVLCGYGVNCNYNMIYKIKDKSKSIWKILLQYFSHLIVKFSFYNTPFENFYYFFKLNFPENNKLAFH